MIELSLIALAPAPELGYHVTLVSDATAAFSMDRMQAAHILNGPNFAHAILTTAQLLANLAYEETAHG
jgi:nicotinamidase-related amidase